MKYYGGQFGVENLFVVTYGNSNGFERLGLGGIWVVAGPYEDKLRAKLVSKLVDALLEFYDVVVRCDVDEFVIPNLDKHQSLTSYIEVVEDDYVTAIGIDVFEGADEGELRLDSPILGQQRRMGALNSALDKTTLTSVSLEWAPGFHATKNPPNFNDLFIFHLKWADLKGRKAWHASMAESVLQGGSEERYFRRLESHDDGHIRGLRSLGELDCFFAHPNCTDFAIKRAQLCSTDTSGFFRLPFQTIESVSILKIFGEHL